MKAVKKFETGKNFKIKDRISTRLAIYFAAALLVFSLIIGTFFILLFREYSFNLHKNELQSRSESIASTFSNFLPSDAHGRGMQGYGAYSRFINDIAMNDVWIVDRNMDIMIGGNQGRNPVIYKNLPADAGKVVEEAFSGQITFSEGFSDLLNVPTLTVGTPIYYEETVIGVVLIHSPVEGITQGYIKGLRILLICIIVALLVSFIVSYFLARYFSSPLHKMTDTSILLTSGNYSAKTGIARDDEIGVLAKSIDELSTKLYEAGKESEKLEQMRKDFISNISHELKTPVTVIRGSLEALIDEVVKEPEKVKEYYKSMLNDSIHLQRLVNDLMDLSKLSNPEFKIESSLVNFTDVLEDSVKSINHKAFEKNIDIKTEFNTEPVPFEGDYGRLRQMILIILDNAVKYSHENTTIKITSDMNRFTIEDQGEGIAQEHLPFIFDRFYRANDTNLGSGLGLAIAKQIAQRHGIELTAESNHGVGAKFSGSW